MTATLCCRRCRGFLGVTTERPARGEQGVYVDPPAMTTEHEGERGRRIGPALHDCRSPYDVPLPTGRLLPGAVRVP